MSSLSWTSSSCSLFFGIFCSKNAFFSRFLGQKFFSKKFFLPSAPRKKPPYTHIFTFYCSFKKQFIENIVKIRKYQKCCTKSTPPEAKNFSRFSLANKIFLNKLQFTNQKSANFSPTPSAPAYGVAAEPTRGCRQGVAAGFDKRRPFEKRPPLDTPSMG